MGAVKDIDYWQVVIPKDKDPKKYTYTERRHELLKAIVSAGDPSGVSRTMMAEKYSKSIGQISQDITVLTEFLARKLGYNSKAITEAVFKKAIDSAMTTGNYKDAVSFIEKWNNILFDHGVHRRAAHEIEHSGQPISLVIEGFKKKDFNRRIDGTDSVPGDDTHDDKKDEN